MDQTGGVRVLLDRMGLDPVVLKIIKGIEADEGRRIDDVPLVGRDVVKRVLAYVDGQTLINCVFAWLAVEIIKQEEAGNAVPQAAQNENDSPATPTPASPDDVPDDDEDGAEEDEEPDEPRPVEDLSLA